MRYTSVLLKHPVPSIEKQHQEDVKETRRRLDTMAAEAQSLQALQNHPGWVIFMDCLKNEELVIMALLERTSEPTALAKVAGSLLVVRSFQTWAEDRASDLLAAIKDAAPDE